MRFYKCILTIIIAPLLGSGFCHDVHAVLITFDFSGDVTYVDTELEETFNTSQSIFGSWTVDSEEPDLSSPDHSGVYELTALTVSIAGLNYELFDLGRCNPACAIVQVFNDASTDGYRVFSYIEGPNAGLPPIQPILFAFLLSSYSTDIFLTDALPLELELADFTRISQWSLKYCDITIDRNCNSSSSGVGFYVKGNFLA